MSAPRNRHEMKRAGYRLERTRRCMRCRDTVEVWRTTHDKQLWLNVAPVGEYADVVSHPFSCAKQPHALTPAEHFHRAHGQSGSRVTIMLLQDGPLVEHMPHLDPDETYNLLMQVARDIRTNLEADQIAKGCHDRAL